MLTMLNRKSILHFTRQGWNMEGVRCVLGNLKGWHSGSHARALRLGVGLSGANSRLPGSYLLTGPFHRGPDNSRKVEFPETTLRPLIENPVSGTGGRKLTPRIAFAGRRHERPGLALICAGLVATGIVGESAADDHRTQELAAF
jgi:hypothetical protein